VHSCKRSSTRAQKKGAKVKKRTALIDEPLGPENASRRQDIEHSFIDIGDLSGGSSIPTNVSDIRVLIGRKGSGKTHVLRHMELRSQSAGWNVFYEELNEAFIENSFIMQVRGELTRANSVNLWVNCWRFAIIAAGFSHFVCRRINPSAKSAFAKSKTSREELYKDFRSFLFDSIYPIGPFAALKKFLEQHKNLASVRDRFARIDFKEAEIELGRLLQTYGDIHYLIDGIDEFAASDPRNWLEPQLGLFKLNFLQRVTRAGTKRIYVTAALRTYVYSHALMDPQADRIKIGAGIVPLNWDPAAATAFMNRRLIQISRKNFARAEQLTGARPLARWLGFDSLMPHSRRQLERVEEYLIRHTRCSPRHIIQMFTQLCRAQNQRYREGGQISEQEFETVVKEQSRAIAKNMLQTAAEELLTYVRWSRDVADRKLLSSARDWYVEAMTTVLSKVIIACEKEVVNRKDFQSVLRSTLTDVVSSDDAVDLVDIVEDALWRSGIIGYRVSGGSQETWRYAWSSHEFGIGSMPWTAVKIGFHPSLVIYCNLEVSPDGPVF
jgi:hypothetical protein